MRRNSYPPLLAWCASQVSPSCRAGALLGNRRATAVRTFPCFGMPKPRHFRTLGQNHFDFGASYARPLSPPGYPYPVVCTPNSASARKCRKKRSYPRSKSAPAHSRSSPNIRQPHSKSRSVNAIDQRAREVVDLAYSPLELGGRASTHAPPACAESTAARIAAIERRPSSAVGKCIASGSGALPSRLALRTSAMSE